ncbi:MAG: formate dehydrogenase subunit delta [Nannocystaceae bacterium]
MKIDKLVKMANEIAAYFDADPDRNAAADGLASHLSRFWEPRMRTQLLAWADEGGEGLAPLVREVIATRRPQLLPRTG